MLVFFLPIIGLSAAADLSYLKDSIVGNWTVELTHPGLPSSESVFYQLRVSKISKENFSLTLFENENSTDVLHTYYLEQADKEAFSFRDADEEEAIVANFSISVRQHRSAIGNYKNYVFNFILGTRHRMDFSLFDHESGEWTIVHLIQFTPEPTFFGKYGMMIFAGGMMIVSIILRMKFAPKYVPPPQAPKANPPAKEQAKEAEKKPKVEVVEENEKETTTDENAETQNDGGENQKSNTRDDVDENGKVKVD